MVQLRLGVVLSAAIAQTLAAQSSGASELVKVEKIQITGTRFELGSVERLLSIRPGSRINEEILRKAIGRMTDSGLVKNVDYYYESASSPTSVALKLSITDEAPLLPASIEIPDVDAEDVWAYLKSIDPVFTRELPRTQKALAYYSRFIERYLMTVQRQEKIASIITGGDDGKADGIVFVPATLLRTPQPRKR